MSSVSIVCVMSSIWINIINCMASVLTVVTIYYLEYLSVKEKIK